MSANDAAGQRAPASAGDSLRFLLVSSGYPPAASAGLERGTQRLATALARRGFRSTVLTLATQGVDAPRWEEGVEVFRVIRPWPLGGLWGAKYMFDITRWLFRLRHRWDVVLCRQLYVHSAVAAPVARRLRRTSANLLAASDSYGDLTRLAQLKGGRLLVRAALSADGMFCMSERIRSELRAAGVAPSRLFGYRNFVDTELFSPAGEHGKEFLFLGRLDPQKNLPCLLDAFERVHATHTEARLNVVGRGSEETAFRDRVAASIASGAIRIESWTDTPVAALRRAIAVVTASDAEGLSNVLIEAIACGTPVITTDVSGARTVLDGDAWPSVLPTGTFVKGVGGLMTNRRDPQALAAAMTAVFESGRLRDELAVAARRRAVDHFSEDVCVQEFVAHVRQLTARRAQTARGAESGDGERPS